MATKVVMAQLSPTMEEGKLVEWKVEEGDHVETSDILAEIETDKANMDIEAMGGGVIRKIIVPEGATVPVGSIIGIIGEEDEDISALISEAEAGAPEPAAAPVTDDSSAGAAAEPQPEVAAPSAEAEEPAPTAEPEPAAEAMERLLRPTAPVVAPGPQPRPLPAGARVKVSPVARRMASEAGLSLHGIAGSGPAGRIVKRDVEAALHAGVPAPATAPPATPAAPLEVGPPRLVDETLELSQMRKAIAKRLAQSIGPVPHFFLTSEIDMGRALDLRADLNARLESGKVGVNDLLVKVTAEALARHPEINSAWAGDAIQRRGSVDIGIAVAIEDGLITPVLRNADRKGLLQISLEAAELITRARERRLLPEEYQGASFSISNLGMFEIDEFTAIINPPEAAILAVGSTVEKPVVVDGQIEVRRRMRVTMSCDHRVIDGATGARFLQTLKAMLENPLEIVL
jgi:pyruvate dehydrogenase E2 component (dihydrolipoamide acetyltransferase)